MPEGRRKRGQVGGCGSVGRSFGGGEGEADEEGKFIQPQPPREEIRQCFALTKGTIVKKDKSTVV